jgi:hypothetical protein
MDDFLIYYLQKGGIKVNMCQSNGLEFQTLAYCNLDISGVMKDSGAPSKVLGDLISIDSDKVIGSIKYTLSFEIPIPLSIQAYRERTTALNLEFQDIPLASLDHSRGTINNLFVEIERATFQRIPLQNQAEIYGVIQYSPAQHGIVTNVVSNTMSPLFNFQTIIPNNITEELDRYLRTSKVFKNLILDYNMFPR